MADEAPAPQADTDRAARIAARCKRVHEKLAAARQSNGTGPQGDVAAHQEMTRTQQQLLDSSRRLLELKFETQQAVTAVRVQGDEHECQRRQRDDRMRQELRAKLLAEAEAAAAANAVIAARWGGVLALNVPQDMFHAIEQQRLACEAVIASKEQLVADIRNALKGKDEQYVKLLKRQAADVDTMLGAMTQQLAQMTEAYRQELENVERVLMQERAELLAANRKEVAALLETRAAAEAAFTDKYLASVSNYAHNLENLRHAGSDDYQDMKIKLEGDIAVLEQHLETMRATYQLNAEKLEYNYRVLLERDAENLSTINQQKRKLSRQHDVLQGLKGKYVRSDARHQEENSKLTEEYKRITEHFRDMQAKSSHFARVDASRYSQLWRLQQREACGLVQQLLAADRVIHEQQLGWGWQPPAQELFVSPHDALVPGDAAAATAAAAAAAADADAGVGAGAGNCAPRSPMTAGSAQLGALSTGSPSSSRASSAGSARRSCGSRTVSSCGAAAVAGEAPCASVGAEADGQAQAEGGRSARRTSQARASPSQHPPGRPEVMQRLRAPRYYGALCLLVDEAGFLIESKAAALLAELPANEPQLVAAEAVVRSLGVTDGPGCDALMDALSADGGAGRATGAPPALVHPDDALLRLKQFVEAETGGALSSPPGTAAASMLAASRGAAAGSQHAQDAARAAGGSASSSAARARRPASAASPLASPQLASGRAVVVSRRAIEREREYWQRLSHAVSERVMRVWGRLEGQLGSYHKLLVARGEGLVAVSRLQAENEGLRELLNQYLGAKVNEQLQVPPLTVL